MTWVGGPTGRLGTRSGAGRWHSGNQRPRRVATSARNIDAAEYPALADDAVIGDGRTAALVSRFGSVDWLCLPHFSGAAVFGALLDRHRGGRFCLCPERLRAVTRRYVGPTNVLETTFRAEGGAVRVTDLMAIAPDGLQPERELLRIVEGLEGEVSLEIRFEPRPDYARAPGRVVPRGDHGFACAHGNELFLLRTDLALQIEGGDAAAGRVALAAGERRYLSLGYTCGTIGVLPGLGEQAERRLADTLRWWEDWSGRCRYRGPGREAVLRSLLTTKLMTHALSGGDRRRPDHLLARGHRRGRELGLPVLLAARRRARAADADGSRLRGPAARPSAVLRPPALRRGHADPGAPSARADHGDPRAGDRRWHPGRRAGARLLNAGDRDANVRITVFFADREPAGPCPVTVPARRTRHVRFNELNDPAPVPRETDYASLIESDVPIVVQHTRLDSRQAELALVSTVAYASD